jgi:hypothetical protein
LAGRSASVVAETSWGVAPPQPIAIRIVATMGEYLFMFMHLIGPLLVL